MTKTIIGFCCWQIKRIPGFYSQPGNRFYYWVLSWAGYYAGLSEEPARSRYLLRRKIRTLITSDRIQAADDAAWWLKTYCRHWATSGIDWQTLDNLTAAERITARQHMETLRRLGRLREGGFRGNFEVIER